jgi:hypothetical protein
MVGNKAVGFWCNALVGVLLWQRKLQLAVPFLSCFFVTKNDTEEAKSLVGNTLKALEQKWKTSNSLYEIQFKLFCSGLVAVLNQPCPVRAGPFLGHPCVKASQTYM